MTAGASTLESGSKGKTEELVAFVDTGLAQHMKDTKQFKVRNGPVKVCPWSTGFQIYLSAWITVKLIQKKEEMLLYIPL